MHTHWCVLIEISMEIGMLNFGLGLLVTALMKETYFSKNKKCQHGGGGWNMCWPLLLMVQEPNFLTLLVILISYSKKSWVRTRHHEYVNLPEMLCSAKCNNSYIGY